MDSLGRRQMLSHSSEAATRTHRTPRRLQLTGTGRGHRAARSVLRRGGRGSIGFLQFSAPRQFAGFDLVALTACPYAVGRPTRRALRAFWDLRDRAANIPCLTLNFEIDRSGTCTFP